MFWLFKPMPKQFLGSETQGNQYLEELVNTQKALELRMSEEEVMNYSVLPKFTKHTFS